MATSLSTLLKRARWEGGELCIDNVPDDWMQGRSVFGGLQIAVAVLAMRQLVPTVPLRTVQATLVAPIAGRLRVVPRVLRTGKNTTHVEARYVDAQDNVQLVCVAVFGTRRGSKIAVTPAQREVVPTAPAKLPFVPGMTPAFIQHFDGTLLRGAFPFTASPVTENIFSVDIRDEGPFTESHLIALADYVPPVGLSHLAQPTPGSTLTWMLELLVDDPSALPLTGFRIDTKLVAARDGYTSQSVTLWGPNGQPLALSNQSMTVFG